MERRKFMKIAGLSMAAVHVPFSMRSNINGVATKSSASKVPLGLCNHSLRSMNLNVEALIEYTIESKLDSLLINSFHPYKSLETAHLTMLSDLAQKNQISIYIGAGSISEKSQQFSQDYNNAEAVLEEGIRVAKTLKSTIVGCRIGSIKERYSDGGIEAHIEASLKAIKAMRNKALDAGIKFAFENHAGDLRSGELLELIHLAGNDVCGALYDPGNAIWAMEDPMKALNILGSNIICTSARDVAVWESEEGATFQWTAIGEGMLDFKKYTETLAEKCPGVPLHIETISNSARPISYLKPDFWQAFPDLKASEMVDFLQMVRRGDPMEVKSGSADIDSKEFEINLQQSEFEKSIHYLRAHCNAVLKN